MAIISKKNAKYLVAFGSTLTRYYDYALFGLSAKALASYFLPGDNLADQLEFFFLIYAFCAIARPIGSIIFGRIGDIYGRVMSIKIAKFMSIIATLAIAFLPSYSEIGIFAAISLIILRMVFLVSISGEVDATRIYITESIAAKYRYLGSALVTLCAQAGVFIATLAYGLSGKFDMFGASWRWCFLLGAIAGLFMLLFRSYLQESELFQKRKKQTDDISMSYLAPEAKPLFMLAVIASGAIGGIYQFMIIFFSSYIQLISSDDANFGASWVVTSYSIGALISGICSIKIPPQRLIYISGISILVLIFLCFALDSAYYQTIICFIAVLSGFILVPVPVMLQGLFKTTARMRLYSLAHSIGSMGISSTTPIFSTYIWQKTGNNASVFIVLTILVLAVLLICHYIYGKKLVRLEL